MTGVFLYIATSLANASAGFGYNTEEPQGGFLGVTVGELSQQAGIG